MVNPELSQSAEQAEPDADRGVARLGELGERFLEATTQQLRSWIWEQTEDVIEAEPQRVVQLGPRRLQRLRSRVGRLERKLPSIVDRKIGRESMWVHDEARTKSQGVWRLLAAALAVVGVVLLPLDVDLWIALAFFAAALLVMAVLLVTSTRRRGGGNDTLRAVTGWWIEPKNASRPVPRVIEQRLRVMTSRLGRIHRRSGLGRRRWSKSPTQSGVLVYWEPFEPSEEMTDALAEYRVAAGELHALLSAHVDEEAERMRQEAEGMWLATAAVSEPARAEEASAGDQDTASD